MDVDVSTHRDRQSSSPLSEPEENASSPPAENRRKSGRATRKPELFSQVSVDDNNAGTAGRPKRKRATPQDEDNEDEGEGEDEVEEGEEDASESDESDGEADEEELKEKRKASRRTSSQKKKKPNAKAKAKPRESRAAKKPKITNGFGTELAIRPAVNGKKKTASKPKKARARPGQIEVNEDGLFGRNISSTWILINILIMYDLQPRSSHEAIPPKLLQRSGSCNTNGTTSMPCPI